MTKKIRKDILRILSFHLEMVGDGSEFKDNVATDIINKIEKGSWGKQNKGANMEREKTIGSLDLHNVKGIELGTVEKITEDPEETVYGRGIRIHLPEGKFTIILTGENVEVIEKEFRNG